jgi:hypothetical protein
VLCSRYRRDVVQEVDVVVRLGERAQTVQSLMSLFPGADEDEVQAVLERLGSAGFVQWGAGGYGSDIALYSSIYSLTPQGKELYQAALDRYANELYGLPSMGVAERFLYVVGEGVRSDDARRRLVALAHTPIYERSAPNEMRRATKLAKDALQLAGDALLRTDNEIAVASFESVRREALTAEDFDHPAKELREHYLAAVEDPNLRAVLEHAAYAAQALWEARPDVGPTADVIERLDDDTSDLLRVADAVSQALVAAGRAGLLDPVLAAEELAANAVKP